MNWFAYWVSFFTAAFGAPAGGNNPPDTVTYTPWQIAHEEVISRSEFLQWGEWSDNGDGTERRTREGTRYITTVTIEKRQCTIYAVGPLDHPAPACELERATKTTRTSPAMEDEVRHIDSSICFLPDLFPFVCVMEPNPIYNFLDDGSWGPIPNQNGNHYIKGSGPIAVFRNDIWNNDPTSHNSHGSYVDQRIQWFDNGASTLHIQTMYPEYRLMGQTHTPIALQRSYIANVVETRGTPVLLVSASGEISLPSNSTENLTAAIESAPHVLQISAYANASFNRAPRAKSSVGDIAPARFCENSEIPLCTDDVTTRVNRDATETLLLAGDLRPSTVPGALPITYGAIHWEDPMSRYTPHAVLVEGAASTSEAAGMLGGFAARIAEETGLRGHALKREILSRTEIRPVRQVTGNRVVDVTDVSISYSAVYTEVMARVLPLSISQSGG